MSPGARSREGVTTDKGQTEAAKGSRVQDFYGISEAYKSIPRAGPNASAAWLPGDAGPGSSVKSGSWKTAGATSRLDTG
jgi:hypothetical protein